ncbi:hypothetical protein FRC01_000725, partial [Tulasnella sp. 417]
HPPPPPSPPPPSTFSLLRMNHSQFEPTLTAVPERPRAFGEDGGHFYRRYDAISDELDEGMVKRLKAQAGLFASVNSAFLAITLPELKADTANDTNVLLLQLVIGGNSSISSAEDLPSATFYPASDILAVNMLFAFSLALIIMASFIALLSSQWIVSYRKRSGGGIELQRWEQLRRYFGIKHWRFEPLLDDILPIFLQTALVVFGFGFLYYLQYLNLAIFSPSGEFLQVMLALGLNLVFIASWDQWCPFQTPISRLLRLTEQLFRKYFRILALMVPLGGIVGMYLSSAATAVLGLFYFPLVIGRLIVYLREVPGPQKAWFTKWVDETSQEPWALSFRADIRWMAFDTVKRVMADLLPPAEDLTYLKATAIKRVLCTFEDFNSLVYTAINIQTMTEKKFALFLLNDDAMFSRLVGLAKSQDKVVATLFSRALAHLFWGGQSVELFVEQSHRHLYSTKPSSAETPSATSSAETSSAETSFAAAGKSFEEAHPLRTMVESICKGFNASEVSPDTGPNDLIALQLYFELLQLILDEQSDSQTFSKWLTRVMERQTPREISTPLVICLVANTVEMLKRGIESAATPNFDVQQQRVEKVKTLVGRVGWEMQSVPSSSQHSTGPSVLEIIRGAFTIPASSHGNPNDTNIWLLEQAVLLLTENPHPDGFMFVAESAVHLLFSFDRSHNESASRPGGQKDNHIRCARTLSQCLEVMRIHLQPDEFIQMVSPALDKFQDYWAKFEDDFKKNPDSNDVDMLSTWLKIRHALDKPAEAGWGPLHQQQFGDAYPSLKLGFDAIALAAQGVETVMEVDQESPELPRVAPPESLAEKKSQDGATAGCAWPKLDERVCNPLEDDGENQDSGNTRGPASSRQQDDERVG